MKKLQKHAQEGATNIGYWEQVLEAPTPAYAELFVREKAFLLSHVPEGARVLDVGCGEGKNMKIALERTPHVTGVDVDPKAVADAQENFADKTGVSVQEVDGATLPFPDHSFDVVTLLMTLPNLEEKKVVVLREADRVLRDDGVFLLSTFAETAFDERMNIYRQVNVPIKEIRGTTVVFDESLGANVSEQFSLEELEQLGDEAGLQLVESEKVGMLAYLCVFKKS
jgi:ubiquinone/menaquinone biosynthesis C-methylase UbiE